jgi:hypothetical protein
LGGNHALYNEISISLIESHADVNLINSENQSALILGIIVFSILFFNKEIESSNSNEN